MYLVIAYDVNTEEAEGRRRLRRVAKACEGRAQRVQDSVFEAKLTQAQWEELRRRLLDLIDPDLDSLRAYRILEPKDEHIEAYGRQLVVDFEAPLVV